MYCIVLYCYYISFHLKIRSNTPPKYRCRYCVIYDFDGLTFDDILSVFSHDRVVGVPFLEINVNVIVMNHAVLLVAGEFVFRQCEFFGLNHHFFEFTEICFLDDIGQLCVTDVP